MVAQPPTNACAPPTCFTRSANATSCCYFVTDLGEQSSDVAVLEALGELTGRRNDARAMLQIGKPSLGRGLALDHYAFPTIGIPPHKQIAPEIEHGMIYAVARTESAFDQRDKSARQCGRPDADHAGSGTRYRQALWRQV